MLQIAPPILAALALSASLLLGPADFVRTQAATSESNAASEIYELLNRERTDRGLHPLAANPKLTAAALAKAEALLAEDTFEHDLRDGRTPWVFIQASGYRYRLAGENLAMDFTEAESMHAAWLASPTHRENMLDPAFADVGIAVVTGEFSGRSTLMVVELFGQGVSLIDQAAKLIP